MDIKRMLGGLLVAGAAIAGPLAVASPAGAATSHCTDHQTEVKVEDSGSPATVTIDGIEVVVTIDGTGFTIEPTDPEVTLTDVSWCVKSGTSTNGGDGDVPRQSESFNRNGQRQGISYVVIYSVDVDEEPPTGS